MATITYYVDKESGLEDIVKKGPADDLLKESLKILSDPTIHTVTLELRPSKDEVAAAKAEAKGKAAGQKEREKLASGVDTGK